MPISNTLTYNQADNSPTKTTVNAKIYASIILPFLNGEEICDIDYELNGRHSPKQEDFQNCPIHDNPELDCYGYEENALKLLITLGITDINEQKDYLDKTKCNNVYQLLCHLYRDGHHQLGTLIDLIDDASYCAPYIKFGLPTFIVSSLTLVGFIWQKYAHPSFISAVASTKDALSATAKFILPILQSARNIAYIGIGIKVMTLAYTTFVTAKDNKRNTDKKRYDISFAVMTTTLAITSYILTAISAGALSTISASFMVASSAVAVVKAAASLRNAYVEYSSYKKSYKKAHGISVKNALKNDSDYTMSNHEKAQYYRALYNFRLKRSLLIQEIITTIAVTLVVATWSFAIFFPPGTVLVVASVAALTLIDTFHTYLTKGFKNLYNNKLQEKLAKLHEAGLKEDLEVAYEAIPQIIDTLNQTASNTKIQTSLDDATAANEETCIELTTERMSPVSITAIDEMAPMLEKTHAHSPAKINATQPLSSRRLSFPSFFNTLHSNLAKTEETQPLLSEEQEERTSNEPISTHLG